MDDKKHRAALIAREMYMATGVRYPAIERGDAPDVVLRELEGFLKRLAYEMAVARGERR